MPKRITYLTKRDDISRDEFRAHWATPHAAIAVGLPGIASYRQNHVISEQSSRYGVDGIVELWFTSDDVVGAGIESGVADRLIEDEQRFLGGIVGGAVRSGPPTPGWAYKIWVLARTTAELSEEALSRWAGPIATDRGAAGYAVNIADADGPQLTRERLHVNPEPPQVSVCFGFAERAEALAASDSIANGTALLPQATGVDVVVTRELIII